jgi:orotate phosphoribosyltransferase-like protein
MKPQIWSLFDEPYSSNAAKVRLASCIIVDCVMRTGRQWKSTWVAEQCVGVEDFDT